MDIRKKAPLTTEEARRKRVGKKVVSNARMSAILHKRLGIQQPPVTTTTQSSAQTPVSEKKKRIFPKLHLTKKQIIVTCAIALVVGGGGYAGYTVYTKYRTEQERQAAAANAIRVEAIEAKAAECRAKKAEEKADQIGTITYDELYDYKSCD